MKVSKIFVACYKYDYWQAKACIASIRYWYPNIEIYLLKDELRGEFSTIELEKIYDVKIYPLKYKKFGWGLSKLEPLFDSNLNQRFLILDADVVFVGPVIDTFVSGADFIVSPDYIDDVFATWINDTYYDYKKLEFYDESFVFPGFVFNTGQFIATGGLVSRADFEGLIDYTGEMPKLLKSDVFACADQGRLNYVLIKLLNNRAISLATQGFMCWSKQDWVKEFKLENIINKVGYPYLIHWAGRNKVPIKSFDRSDIFLYYLRLHYTKVKLGAWKLMFLELLLKWKYGTSRVLKNQIRSLTLNTINKISVLRFK